MGGRLMPIQLVPKRMQRARVAFNRLKFERALAQHGETCRWEVASLCPCGTKASYEGASYVVASGLPHCPKCGGRGRLYHAPTRPGSADIKALVLDASRDTQLARQYGDRSFGMAMFTVAPWNLLGLFHRLTVLDQYIVYSETLTRRLGEDEVSLTYPIAERTLTSGEDFNPTMEVETKEAILFVSFADTTGAFVDTPLVDGTDYERMTNGKFKFLSALVPVGANYSVDYVCNPRYIVQSIPYATRTDFTTRLPPKSRLNPHLTTMPVQAHCWLEQLGPPIPSANASL